MLSVYTNQTDLLRATSTIEVSRLQSIDRQLLDIRNFSDILHVIYLLCDLRLGV